MWLVCRTCMVTCMVIVIVRFEVLQGKQKSLKIILKVSTVQYLWLCGIKVTSTMTFPSDYSRHNPWCHPSNVIPFWKYHFFLMLLLSFVKCKVLLDWYVKKRERDKNLKIQIIVNIVGWPNLFVSFKPAFMEVLSLHIYS